MNKAKIISDLASRPKVKKIAVENFLNSLPMDTPKHIDIMNMLSDAACYGWNTETKAAIRDGIDAIK